jgi:hypothetical protein
LTEAVDYVKTELMPNFDFDAYNHDQVEVAENDIDEVAAEAPTYQASSAPAATASSNGTGSAADAGEEVDKW